MMRSLIRYFRLFMGYVLCAVGIVLSVNANIGYSPWDVLHAGVARTAGISFGTAVILVGLVLVIVGALCGEQIGFGTFANMFVLGAVIDIVNWLEIIPLAAGFIWALVMIIAGLFTLALGTYSYMGAAYGSGPKDGLMIIVARKTGWPMGVCRAATEALALSVGWFLGGMVGIGTLIAAAGIGPCIQLVFRLLRFDAAGIRHESMRQTCANIKNQLETRRRDRAVRHWLGTTGKRRNSRIG